MDKLSEDQFALQNENQELRAKIVRLESELADARRQRPDEPPELEGPATHGTLLFESMLQGVVYQDADGKIISMNPAAQRILGKTPEQFLGRTSTDEEHHTLREDGSPFPGLQHPSMLALASGREVPNVVMGVYNPREKAYRWIDVTAVPLFRANESKPYQVYTIFDDITAWRQADEERRRLTCDLADRVGELHAILDAAPVAIWIAHDAQCSRITGNAYADQIIMQVPRGGNVSRSASSDDAAAVYRVFQNGVELPPEALPAQVAAATGKPAERQEQVLVFADGRTVHLLASAVPLFDAGGGVRGAICAGLDVTQLRLAEEALRQASEQRLLTLEAAELGAWDYRFDSGEVFWDERCRNMFGVPAGDQVDYRDAIGRIHPEDRAAIDKAVNEAIAGADGGKYHREFRVVWPDGSVHWVASHGCAYFEGGGAARRAIRFIGVNLDITDRKRTEENLQQAQKLESIGLLAGGIAHDFNNLLVGVIGNASLAADMLLPDHPAIELMQKVVKIGEQAAHLTRQMLAYSGKGRFLVEALDLSNVVAEISELVRPSIAKKVRLHLDLESNLPPVEADRGQIQQVAMNLILNAGEAIGSNAGLISVRTGVEELTARAFRHDVESTELCPGRHVFLEVRDDGCGMDESTRAKIFDPFFSTKFTGRGLGLAAVAGILRGHKGAIRVSSEPGKGSCFVALFPAAQSPAPVPAGAPTGRQGLCGAGAVLVVDDEIVVREVARHTLERNGFAVLLADSGPGAIDIFKREPSRISLVLLDLSMPGMGGEELLPELRKIRPAVRVVVSSGYSETETMRCFHGQAVSGFIQKPYTSRQLVEIVKTVIGSTRTPDPTAK